MDRGSSNQNEQEWMHMVVIDHMGNLPFLWRSAAHSLTRRLKSCMFLALVGHVMSFAFRWRQQPIDTTCPSGKGFIAPYESVIAALKDDGSENRIESQSFSMIYRPETALTK